jgi:hypothetical protein
MEGRKENKNNFCQDFFKIKNNLMSSIKICEGDERRRGIVRKEGVVSLCRGKWIWLSRQKECGYLQHNASSSRRRRRLLCFLLRENGGADGDVEDFHQALLCHRTALHILRSLQFVRERLAHLVGHWLQVAVSQTHQHRGVLAKIRFGSNENKWGSGAIVHDFGIPLRPRVLVRCGRNNGETEQENVGLWVRQGSQSVVFFLPGSVPQAQVNRLSVDHHIGGIVIKHSWHVLRGKRVGGVGDQHAGFPDRTITNGNALDRLHSLFRYSTKECFSTEDIFLLFFPTKNVKKPHEPLSLQNDDKDL